MGIPQRLGTIPLAIFTDASNNIGIGGSPSGSYKFEVTGTGRFTGTLRVETSSSPGLNIVKDANADNRYIRLTNSQASAKNWDIINQTNANGNSFQIYNHTDSITGLTITPNGNVGIGTSSPANILHAYSSLPRIISDTSTRFAVFNLYYQGSEKGAFYLDNQNKYIITEANGDNTYQLLFRTAGTEKMRITTETGTANVCIGTTSSPQANTGRGALTINGSSSSIVTFATGGGEKGYVYANGTDMYYVNSYAGGGRLYCQNSTGGVYLTQGATSWTANSDERLKDITGNIENAVDSLMTLRAVKHTWKADEDKVEKLALIAQDVEKVFPQIVDKGKLPSKPNEEQTDETEYLGVRYQELIPVLVKAIQELSAKVEALENK